MHVVVLLRWQAKIYSFSFYIDLVEFEWLQFQRRNRIYKEEQRQIRAAARKAKGEDDGESPHH